MTIQEEIAHLEIQVQATTSLKEKAILISKLIKKHGFNSHAGEGYIKQLRQLAEELDNDEYRAWSHYHYGNFQRITGDRKTALAETQKGLKIFVTLKNKKGIADSYNSIGTIYEKLCNYPDALHNYELSLKTMIEINDKLGVAHAYMNISLVYGGQGDYPEALSNCKAAIEIMEEVGDKSGVADVYNNMGNIYRSQGDYARSLSSHLASLKIKQEINNIWGVAASYNNIAGIYHAQGNYPGALFNYFDSLKVMKQANDRAGIATIYNNLGAVYYSQGSYKESLTSFKDSLKIREEIGDRQGIADTLGNIGEVYYNQGNYQEAHTNFLAFLKISQEIGYRHGIAMAHNNIGNLYFAQGNYADALSNYQVALAIREEIGDKRGIAESHHTIAAVYYSKGNYPDSLANNMISLNIKKELGDKEGISKSYNNIGLVYFSQANYPESLSSQLAALKIREEIGDKRGIAASYNNVGIVYESQGNFNEALTTHLSALKIEKELGNKYGIATSHFNIGAACNRLRNYSEALSNLEISLQIRKEIGDKNGIAVSHVNLGNVYGNLSNYHEAVTSYTASLKIMEEIGNKQGIANAYLNIGMAKTTLNELEQAAVFLEKAQKLSEEIGDKSIKMNTLNAWYLLKKAEGKGMVALDYYEQFIVAEKELHNEETSKKIAGLQFGYQIEKKEQEVVFERQKKEELSVAYDLLGKEKEEAERQRHRAEQSERFKQMFLANMSHEIRTPMNAIVGMTNLLLTEPQSDNNLRYLNAIKHSSNNLLVVINDVLDLSKIEAGKLRLEYTSFNLYQQLELLREMFDLKTAEKKLKFEISIDPATPQNHTGDPYRLNQVLVNLLGNAVKFTGKGKVGLNITIAGKNQYRFTITDTGIGIPADKINSIFESFTQAESDTTRQYGGTGLGLTISKQLVELMGGKMEVKSKPGKGSEFAFTILLKPGVNAKTLPKQKLQQQAAKLKNIHILLAEDNAYNQIVAVDTLKKLIPKVEITVVENGKQVLQKLKANTYNIVLMDLHMPKMDGYEAVMHIRETQNQVPILALTASVIRADIDRCLRCGMNGYISKPFSAEELIGEIYKQLSNKASILAIKKSVKPGTPNIPKKQINQGQLYDFTEGDPVAMKKYIDLFIETVPGYVKRVENAIKQSDCKSLYSALHTIKPQLNFMGAVKVVKKIEPFEMKLKKTSKLDNEMKQAAMDINNEIVLAIEEWKSFKLAIKPK